MSTFFPVGKEVLKTSWLEYFCVKCVLVLTHLKPATCSQNTTISKRPLPFFNHFYLSKDTCFWRCPFWPELTHSTLLLTTIHGKEIYHVENLLSIVLGPGYYFGHLSFVVFVDATQNAHPLHSFLRIFTQFDIYYWQFVSFQ